MSVVVDEMLASIAPDLVEFEQRLEASVAADFGPFASAASVAQALPTGLSTDGSAFSVSYSALDQTTQPNPFGGGNF